MSHLKIALAGCVVVIALASSTAFRVHAQNAADAPPKVMRIAANDDAPLYDPNQLPAFKGKVQQFTLTPRGEIDGFILMDGTEVKIPPYLSSQIASAVKPGDAVTIHGLKAASLPLVQASSVTDEVNGNTVVDPGLGQGFSGPGGPFGRHSPGRPGGPGGPRPPFAANRMPPDFRTQPAANTPPAEPQPGLTELQGEIKMMLHGPRADVNGAMLADGTILRLPPPAFIRYADLLQPGKTIVVEGDVVTNQLGKLFIVRQLGPSRDQLRTVMGPFMGGMHGPGGEHRGPMPPPDAPDDAPEPPPPDSQ